MESYFFEMFADAGLVTENVGLVFKLFTRGIKFKELDFPVRRDSGGAVCVKCDGGKIWEGCHCGGVVAWSVRKRLKEKRGNAPGKDYVKKLPNFCSNFHQDAKEAAIPADTPPKNSRCRLKTACGEFAEVFRARGGNRR